MRIWHDKVSNLFKSWTYSKQSVEQIAQIIWPLFECKSLLFQMTRIRLNRVGLADHKKMPCTSDSDLPIDSKKTKKQNFIKSSIIYDGLSFVRKKFTRMQSSWVCWESAEIRMGNMPENQLSNVPLVRCRINLISVLFRTW